MTRKELRMTVQLLKAGQAVEIAGDFFQAVKVPDSYKYRACELCELDSICRGVVAEVCQELDWPTYDKWYLKLAHP